MEKCEKCKFRDDCSMIYCEKKKVCCGYYSEGCEENCVCDVGV